MVVILILLAIPLLLTIVNIINLFLRKPFLSKLFDLLTMFLGASLTIFLFNVLELKQYTEPIILDGIDFKKHTFVSFDHVETILVMAGVALVGYFALRLSKQKKAPLITAFFLACVYIGCVLSILLIIQLAENLFTSEIETIYFSLFPVNFILCSIRLIKNVIINQINEINSNDWDYQNKILVKFKSILSHSISWIIFPFILMLPILAVMVLVLIVFGQKPDSMIRAFTETSDWTFSKKISPPPIEFEYSHYLCTVALNGNEKLVKPTRLGIRHGEKIVVNRQLCVANAFEQYIQEKLPRFHHMIRSFYDKYGYPLSKHITTTKRADIIYIAMKPLEWLFLVFLYIFDKSPENRIALQYTGDIKLIK